MNLYKRIVELFDANLIYCLIPIILSLMIIEMIYKNRFETRKTLNIIRWTIIVYTIITGILYLIETITSVKTDGHEFINRARGPYAWAYWMMFLSALILPLTLFIKKLASKFWYVLLIAFGMKIGMYLERFVIIVTSFHRDFLPSGMNYELKNVLSFRIGAAFLQGIIITILILGLFEIMKRNQTMSNN
ncbi:MAG: hypothetical protein ACPGSD_08610 [Flavobacteriales bacterium]